MTSREYNLYLTPSQKWSLYLPAAMFILMPVIFIIAFSTVPEFDQRDLEGLPFPIQLFFGVFVLFGMLMLWPILAMPNRISVSSGTRITFASRFRSKTVEATDVLSIKPSPPRWPQMPLQFTTYALKHQNGTLRFPGQFTDQHRFFTELKQANPGVELLGC